MKNRELAIRTAERVKAHDVLFREREKQVQLAFAAGNLATAKAEEAQQRVNAAQNEFRGALSDQADRLASKGDLAHLESRVKIIEELSWKGAGRSGGFGSAQALLFQVLPILVAIAAVVIALIQK